MQQNVAVVRGTYGRTIRGNGQFSTGAPATVATVHSPWPATVMWLSAATRANGAPKLRPHRVPHFGERGIRKQGECGECWECFSLLTAEETIFLHTHPQKIHYFRSGMG